MTLDVQAGLVAFLPKTLTVANGDSFSLTWVDGMARHDDLTPPYGSFSPITTVLQRRRDMGLKGNDVETGTNRQDTFTFDTTQSDYVLSHPDLLTLNNVTGTLSGTANHTFVEDTDFEITQAPDYSTPSQISWLSAGDNPDGGTDFTIDYDSRTLRLHSRIFERVSYRLGIHAKDMASGEGGATRAYNAVDLSNQLGESLMEFFVANKGVVVASDDDAHIRFREFESYGGIRLEEGEATAANPFDIVLHRVSDVFTEEVEVIGKVQTSTDATT